MVHSGVSVDHESTRVLGIIRPYLGIAVVYVVSTSLRSILFVQGQIAPPACLFCSHLFTRHSEYFPLRAMQRYLHILVTLNFASSELKNLQIQKKLRHCQSTNTRFSRGYGCSSM